MPAVDTQVRPITSKFALGWLRSSTSPTHLDPPPISRELCVTPLPHAVLQVLSSAYLFPHERRANTSAAFIDPPERVVSSVSSSVVRGRQRAIYTMEGVKASPLESLVPCMLPTRKVQTQTLG